LSAVRDADAIAVLADGQIVERGTHAELMASTSRYARLFRLQASGYQQPHDPHDNPGGPAGMTSPAAASLP
jgi:ATP-binding cassette subfamily B protein